MKVFDIQQKCSKYFTYSDLINCGETLAKTPNLNNNPENEETYKAIGELCSNILDPVQDKFGKIKLTYGFASNNLTRKIKKDIYPKLDQHSGYEKNRKGEYICQRLGLACDCCQMCQFLKEIVLQVFERFSNTSKCLSHP